MAYEQTTTPKVKMDVALRNDAVNTLGKTLQLTDEQLAKAKSSALQLGNNPALNQCDPYSIIRYCFETARYNFTRDDCVYPVPYGKSIQTQISYKGYRELAMRSGKYLEISASPVYECDSVYRDEETGNIKVKFNPDIKAVKDSEIIGYYAYAKRTDGTISNNLYMSVEELTTHGKAYSKTYNSIWGTELGFKKMAIKTVIKQLCKELDQTKDLTNAIRVDQSVVNTDFTEHNTYADNPHNDTGEVIEEIEMPY